MKNLLKYLPFVFILLLLLCACTRQEEPPGASEPVSAQPTPPSVLESQPIEEDNEAVFYPDSVSEPEPEPEPDPKELAVKTILSSMTLEEKVGQMFFVRCPEINAEEKISTYHLGGYLLFLRDFKDILGSWLTAEAFMDKIASYQDASPIPLFIGVDEEGGTVARASRNPNLFPEKCKSPQKLFLEDMWTAIENDAINKNRDLLSYGINVNFAPVADVSTNPSDFIYDRAFGQDAQATAKYVETVVKGAAEAGAIGCVLKHFPGYGNNVDTHTGVAIDERPYEQFISEDFLPFQAGIKAGAGSVLVSHNVVKCMDENFPASLSSEVHRILREDLGFEGVILTDDLAMDAVEAYAKDGSVAVLAVLAGNDMIVTTDFEKQIPLVIDAVQTGIIQESMIDDAVRRVLGWKYDLGLLDGLSK
ncbi:MAG: beta-hexosaminidase [Oscillospiraceae bacterium]|nr:beta-hexosaminidase [Oscillospiraceae bacterium]